jgi:hypothetical protein
MMAQRLGVEPIPVFAFGTTGHQLRSDDFTDRTREVSVSGTGRCVLCGLGTSVSGGGCVRPRRKWTITKLRPSMNPFVATHRQRWPTFSCNFLRAEDYRTIGTSLSFIRKDAVQYKASISTFVTLESSGAITVLSTEIEAGENSKT